MNVAISRALLDQILAHAEGNPGEEVCGLLFGNRHLITGVQATANVAADAKRTFEVDPAALIAAHRASRVGGPNILGHYHSHPGGRADPSVRDADAAMAGSLWLIVARGDVALFEGVIDGPIHGRFRRVGLTITQDRVAQAPRHRHKGTRKRI